MKLKNPGCQRKNLTPNSEAYRATMDSRCCVCPGEIVSTGKMFGRIKFLRSQPELFQKKWRKVRDSNPRDAINAYTISSRAPSTNSDNFPFEL